MKINNETMRQDRQDENLQKRAHAYGLEYAAGILDRGVYPTESAVEKLAVFREDLPVEPTQATEVIDQLHEIGSPATVAISGGRYFGFVNGSYTPAGLAAKTLATFWDQNTAMNILSPVCATLESTVEKWLVNLLGLPPQTVAGFVSGSSLANYCGLAAARYRILERQGWDVNEQGLFGAPPIKVVTGNKVHSTVKKAIGLLGLGNSKVAKLPVDQQGRIITAELPEIDAQTIVILQAGEVNTGAFDDFETICDLANAAGAWIHIDGAFGLWAAAVPELQHLTKGIEKAHSWAVDGHKTLNTPYDCGIALCADQEALVAALHMSGSYLVLSEDQRDPMFYTPDMSRRARIVELWATMKYLGRSGIAEMVYELHARAVQFGELFDKLDGFTLLNDIVFNQVLIQCDTDELTEKVLAFIHHDRVCWAGGSSWNGRRTIRISVCSWLTTPEDVERSVDSFRRGLLS